MNGSETLSTVFGRGQAAVADLLASSLDTASPEFQMRVKEATRDLLVCFTMVARGEVYSANEEAQDMSAQSLRFVLVPYYLAELAQMVVDDKRAAHLARAQTLFGQYLETAHRLGLMEEADVRVWQRTTPAAGEARREQKLERGRREMQLKKQLKDIRAQLAANEAARVDDDAGIDEELFRTCVTLEVQLACRKTLEALDLIAQELPLLQHREQMQRLEAATTDAWKQQGRAQDAPPQAPAKPLSVELPPGYIQTPGPRGAFTITRSQLKEQVFRPGYTMHTVSVEEAGERDYQEAMERAAREARNAAARAEEPDEDDTVHYDSVTVYKDRDWDAFVDANPKGSGNTMGNLG